VVCSRRIPFAASRAARDIICDGWCRSDWPRALLQHAPVPAIVTCIAERRAVGVKVPYQGSGLPAHARHRHTRGGRRLGRFCVLGCAIGGRQGGLGDCDKAAAAASTGSGPKPVCTLQAEHQ
jgi:hypothetical protein